MRLEGDLARLENSQLVRRSDDFELAYVFKHTLSQETAYSSLLVKRRRQVHRQVAQSIERLYADRLDEFAPLLARHYNEAGDDVKTLEYATRAADGASRIYANGEAVANYSLALDVA
jgi:predicted ATPase